jgi:predicted transcriptional regulator of viral defense system
MPLGRAVRVDNRGEPRTRHRDRAIAALAGRQHGIVTRGQLRELGLSDQTIDRRLSADRLHALYRGIYSVGHRALTVEARWMAAVLACGRGAVLSHRTAAAAWQILPSARRAIDVTVPRGLHARRGIDLHRSHLPPDEVTVHRGIPVTTVARTLLDLAAVAARRHVERAIIEAEIRGLTDRPPLPALLARYPRRLGIGTISAILDALDAGPARTRSELEDAFRDFLRRTQLPPPEFNAALFIEGSGSSAIAYGGRRV